MSETKEISYGGKTAKVLITDPNDHIQKRWVQGNFYECQRNGLLPYIYANYPNPTFIIDVGASIGNHTLFFAKVMGADVLAFEPYKPSFERLEANITLERDVEDKVVTENIALSDRNGMVGMKPVSDTNAGMARVVEGDEVECMKLDSYKLQCNWIEKVEWFDIMKVDIEHHNEQFLKGAATTLKAAKGDVFIEAETPEQLAICDRYMTMYGYTRNPDVCLNHTPTYLWQKK